MKVLFANNYYYLRGGSERVLFDEIAWLQAKGKEVIPFSRRDSRNPSTPYDHLFPPVIEYGELSGLEKVRAAVNIVYSRSTKRAMGKVLDAEKPGIVHGHNIYGGLTYSIIDAAWQRNIPVILTLHDLKLACPSYLMLNHGEICELCGRGSFWHCLVERCHKDSFAASLINAIEAYFNKYTKKYDRAARFLCPSRFLLNKIHAAGISREKLVYLPNALDPERYEPSFGRGAYALFAGRLSKEKGVLTLLEAFRDMNLPLRIAGTGPLEEKCRMYADRHGMKHVTFEGHCQGGRLRALFRQCAFLVIPSEWYENAPMSILEAFAYGKPVLGSGLGGIPELVIPNETGMLYDAGSVDELRNNVAVMWEKRDSELLAWGRQARMRVENEFSAERHVASLLEVYETVIQ